MVGCLGNIAGAGNLTVLIRISLWNIALPVHLGIPVPLAVSSLPGISLLPLCIILLGIWILIGALIRNCGRLACCVSGLLAPLSPDNRLVPCNLRCLIDALGRLVSCLL